MTRRGVLAGLVGLLLVAAACGDSGPDGDDQGEAAPSIRVATFNAGLARGFVDLVDERLPEIIDAIAALDADIVAVQEVWEPDDVRALGDGVRGRFPEQLFLDPAPEAGTEPACTAGELAPLESCVQTNCAGVAASDLAACVLSRCGAEYEGVCETCQTCLAANVGGDLAAVTTACTTAAERYAYGGSFGIGLLSRHPIVSSDHVVLESSLNRRALVHAVVDAGELGTVHVIATHLSPVFASVPYPGEGTWQAEQAAQIERMLELVTDRVPAGEPVVVLGDLNTGPAIDGAIAEVPENFAMIARSGLTAPHLEPSSAVGCTFCADNPLVASGTDDEESVAIDHVLLGDLAATTVDRILDDAVTIKGAPSRLSDHYGVAATLTRRDPTAAAAR